MLGLIQDSETGPKIDHCNILGVLITIGTTTYWKVNNKHVFNIGKRHAFNQCHGQYILGWKYSIIWLKLRFFNILHKIFCVIFEGLDVKRTHTTGAMNASKTPGRWIVRCLGWHYPKSKHNNDLQFYTMLYWQLQESLDNMIECE